MQFIKKCNILEVMQLNIVCRCLTFVGRSSNSPPQNVFINNACDSLVSLY